ncbi:hypothetical protein [Methanosarcina sp.]|uniref:hypothetical protein n=1 Tax=Methanosarcina sp. TaxID=2213 RepID=UPI003C754EB1
MGKIHINTLIGDVILGVNNGRHLRLSPVISAYPDDEFENLQIEVILPGYKRKILPLRSPKMVFI